MTLPPTEKRAWIAHVTGSEGGAVDWREIRLHRGLNECRCPGQHQWTKETEFVVVPIEALREAEAERDRLRELNNDNADECVELHAKLAAAQSRAEKIYSLLQAIDNSGEVCQICNTQPHLSHCPVLAALADDSAEGEKGP